MLGNITMTFTPTYGVVFPLASVDTISLGNPMGKARMAAVPIAVPPPPPREISPWIRPVATSCDTTNGAAFTMAATASPRSRLAASAENSIPAAAVTSLRVMSGFKPGSWVTFEQPWGKDGQRQETDKLVEITPEKAVLESTIVENGFKYPDEEAMALEGPSRLPTGATDSQCERDGA